MKAISTDDSGLGPDTAAALKRWMIVGMTSVFALLYGGALLAGVRPLAGEGMISRILNS
ncbi:MAG TPA: hypothetical protein VF762_02845 [Blastocatellia bacterium]|jgi:hypothetical protein